MEENNFARSKQERKRMKRKEKENGGKEAIVSRIGPRRRWKFVSGTCSQEIFPKLAFVSSSDS